MNNLYIPQVECPECGQAKNIRCVTSTGHSLSWSASHLRRVEAAAKVRNREEHRRNRDRDHQERVVEGVRYKITVPEGLELEPGDYSAAITDVRHDPVTNETVVQLQVDWPFSEVSYVAPEKSE